MFEIRKIIVTVSETYYYHMATPAWLGSRSTVLPDTRREKKLIEREQEEWARTLADLSFPCYHEKSVLFTCHVMHSPSPYGERGARFCPQDG